MQSSRGDHPDPAQMESFMRGELAGDEARAVVRHMLTECQQCIAMTRPFWRRGDRSPGLEALLKEMVAEAGGTGRLARDEPGWI